MHNWKRTLTAEAETELREAGILLAEARRRRGLSVRKLAARMGVDRRTLAQLEEGSPSVSLGVFFQALSALDLLRGMSEVLRPENDIEGISAAVRRARKRLPPLKAIKDDEVEF
ncbi:helix-turn-helix domain-containing protein [Elusimicrobiota bacterium]